MGLFLPETPHPVPLAVFRVDEKCAAAYGATSPCAPLEFPLLAGFLRGPTLLLSFRYALARFGAQYPLGAGRPANPLFRCCRFSCASAGTAVFVFARQNIPCLLQASDFIVDCCDHFFICHGIQLISLLTLCDAGKKKRVIARKVFPTCKLHLSFPDRSSSYGVKGPFSGPSGTGVTGKIRLQS